MPSWLRSWNVLNVHNASDHRIGCWKNSNDDEQLRQGPLMTVLAEKEDPSGLSLARHVAGLRLVVEDVSTRARRSSTAARSDSLPTSTRRQLASTLILGRMQGAGSHSCTAREQTALRAPRQRVETNGEQKPAEHPTKSCYEAQEEARRADEIRVIRLFRGQEIRGSNSHTSIHFPPFSSLN
jgi:hypothetical protein